MANSRVINVDHIGPVLLERSARARRIVISVRPRKGVRVAVPARVPFRQAVDFVHTKKEWIRKHLEIIRRLDSRQKALAGLLEGIDRVRAEKTLTARLLRLARRYGFACHRVSVRNQKTRWGSCSHNNAVSLNVKLVILPGELQDYVLLHELVHTRIHNHSPAFWRELDKYVGDARALATRLREYDLRLMS
ncbi:MAG: hypothetical protein A2Z29_03870 [Chloroflexi bacterium RBG_16_56_11]|nr:MAG: hypothetical protein A2Z29_03870 [Chloroflexi bacterium RBG_16_56_11]